MTVVELSDLCRAMMNEGMGELKVVVNYGKNELANGQLASAVTVIRLLVVTESGELKDTDLEEFYNWDEQLTTKEMFVNITSGSLP